MAERVQRLETMLAEGRLRRHKWTAQADAYLRQIGRDVPEAVEARRALLEGDIALAYALVRGMQGRPLGRLADACADYARRALREAHTPALPRYSEALYRAWLAQQA